MQKSFWCQRISVLVFIILPVSTSMAQTSEPMALSTRVDETTAGLSTGRDALKWYCRSGRQIRRLSVWVSERVTKPKPGTPLDQAIEEKREQLVRIRWAAKHYFLHDENERSRNQVGFNSAPKNGDFELLHTDYTMIIPPADQQKFHLRNVSGSNSEGDWRITQSGGPLSSRYWGYLKLRPSPSAAVHDQSFIWDDYTDEFTTVKEAQSSDPYEVNFQISLDLNLFCSYARAIADLVSH